MFIDTTAIGPSGLRLFFYFNTAVSLHVAMGKQSFSSRATHVATVLFVHAFSTRTRPHTPPKILATYRLIVRLWPMCVWSPRPPACSLLSIFGRG